MLQQRVKKRVHDILRTGRGRLAVGLVGMLVLAGCGYTVTMHGPLSVEIIVRTAYTSFYAGQPQNPDVTVVFDKTITDSKLATDLGQALDGLPRGVSGGCAIDLPGVKGYSYEFRLSRDGVTTEVYSGSVLCATWIVTQLGIPFSVAGADGTALYGYNLMTTLRKLVGMPLPSNWSATLPVP